MDNYTWLFAMLLTEQRERLLAAQQPLPRPPARPPGPGLRRTLAATIVRPGLRLDPAAGEGLGTDEPPLARQEVPSPS